jgi:hypothetical protein
MLNEQPVSCRGLPAASDQIGNWALSSKKTRVDPRIVVFAHRPEVACEVAEEIAHTAFGNSSYFGGAFTDLKQAGLW